jgi:hypothetical protein
MKHQYPAVIQFTVEYFKGIAHTVETDKQVLFLITFYRKIIPSSTKRPPYIVLRHMMFESRRFAYNVRIHV